MSLAENRMRIVIIIPTTISLFMPVEAGSKIALLFYLGLEQVTNFGLGIKLIVLEMPFILQALIHSLSNPLEDSHWSGLFHTLVWPAYLVWVYAVPFLLICNIVFLLLPKGRFRVILHTIYCIWLFFALISSLYECSGFHAGSYWRELGFWLVPLLLFLSIIVEVVVLLQSKQPAQQGGDCRERQPVPENGSYFQHGPPPTR